MKAVLATNKRAHFHYQIIEKLEAGIVLIGCEVKSMRKRTFSIQDSYVRIINNELWLVGCHIHPFKEGNRENKDPLRNRKLLVHAKQLAKLIGKVERKGFTLIPLQVYLLNQYVKLEIGLGKSKDMADKRRDIKEKDIKRSLQRRYKQ